MSDTISPLPVFLYHGSREHHQPFVPALRLAWSKPSIRYKWRKGSQQKVLLRRVCSDFTSGANWTEMPLYHEEQTSKKGRKSGSHKRKGQLLIWALSLVYVMMTNGLSDSGCTREYQLYEYRENGQCRKSSRTYFSAYWPILYPRFSSVNQCARPAEIPSGKSIRLQHFRLEGKYGATCKSAM